MGKSKFITFILSAVPGLGHFYLGLMNRGLVVMGIFFGVAGTVAVLAEVTHSEGPMVLLAVLPVIWFYGLFDALILCQRLKLGEKTEDRSPLMDLTETLAAGERSRFWALVFGMIPGAGHMYLGWQEKGLELMLAFFLSIFLIDWLRLSLFLFLLPVIWFYSFFEVLQLISGSMEAPPRHNKNLLSWVVTKRRWVGFALIFLGVVILFDRLVVPYLSYQLINTIKTGLVALLLIGGGLRLAFGAKIPLQNDVGQQLMPVEKKENPAGERNGQQCGNGE